MFYQGKKVPTTGGAGVAGLRFVEERLRQAAKP